MGETSSGQPCYHCGLPVVEAALLTEHQGGVKRKFCCDACRRVCSAIYEAGLEGYYERSGPDRLGIPPPKMLEPAFVFDDPATLEEISTVSGKNSRRQTTLLINGLHCPACVWLIERSLHGTSGVTSATVNLSGKRLLLGWDQEQVSLSRLLELLESIGYAAIPNSEGAADKLARVARRDALYRISYAGFAAMNLMWISIALWTGAATGPFVGFFLGVEMALATPLLLYSAWPFLRGAVTGLRAGVLTMDLPVAIGALAIYSYSSYVTIVLPADGEAYFDTLGAFVFVLLIGRYLESRAREHSGDATSRLMALQPRSVRLVDDEGAERLASIREVMVGSLVAVRPGERMPVDGLVEQGGGYLDESMLTGESAPVHRGPGDPVTAGTVNDNGAFVIRVTAAANDSALARMARLIEQAQASRAPIQRFADTVVPRFVAGVLLVALGTFFYWLDAGFETALIRATSVLIVTCPCALGLAAPLAIAYAVGLGASNGILVKDGAALETLARIDRAVFDKTGVLTVGDFRFVDMELSRNFSADKALALVAAVEKNSEHPLGKALVTEAEERGLTIPACELFRAYKGEGVTGRVDGSELVVGTFSFVTSNSSMPDSEPPARAEHEISAGRTTIFAAVDGRYAGRFTFGDQLKEDAKATLARLERDGIGLSVFTGDRAEVAEAMIGAAGLSAEISAEMTPDEKGAGVESLRANGEVVAMIGDGVNDAPALAAADVGIAMATGSDVSVAAADVVVTGEKLMRVVDAMHLGRLTVAKIRQNLALSLGYNAIMAPLAVAGYITPVVAAIAMPLSSLAVIFNASRLQLGNSEVNK